MIKWGMRKKDLLQVMSIATATISFYQSTEMKVTMRIKYLKKLGANQCSHRISVVFAYFHNYRMCKRKLDD